MPDVNWEDAFCGEGNSCYRIGIDDRGNSYIAVNGSEERFLTDSREALQQLIRDIKAGKADHLL
jgi:DNA invertase Pin-like site-specific DNA recombinase